ncbi:MAG: PLP-dependent aspartate aminotransferase family protein [Clostridia bacterium]|nr:PLP-dependent aspartate aminotransferase family protein [Clostridia bacterium]
MEFKGFNTRAIHVGQKPDKTTGAVVPPIYLTSTYDQNQVDELKYFYSRGENPTRFSLEETIASLDNAKYALAFSSGQAAGLAAMSFLKPGDRILSVDDVYGGTYNLFKSQREEKNVEFEFIDMTKPDNLHEAIKSDVRLIWIETPTNPLLKIIDIEAVCKIARSRNIKVLVDNTFLTSYLQNPLELGADFVLYSTTKYFSGHLDVIGGALVFNDDETYEKLKFYQTTAGAVPSPFDSWILSRGLKTLGLRMDKHVENALSIADFLEKSPKVEKVIYPGLKSHPQYELAKKQMRKPGGIISFYYKGDIAAFMKNLELFSCAVSLGGVNSLIECPALMTHRPIPREERLRQGISDSLIRLSVGIEDIDDLIKDLENHL